MQNYELAVLLALATPMERAFRRGLTHDELIGIIVFVALAILPILPFAYYTLAHFSLRKTRNKPALRKKLVVSGVAMAAIYGIVCVDGFLIEPNWVELSQIELGVGISAPLRILHLSDLHIETDFPLREQWLVKTVARLKPDLILITGDIHQVYDSNVASCQRVLEQINASLGVYAVIDDDKVSVLKEAKPDLTILQDEAVVIPHDNDTIGLVGLNRGSKKASVSETIRGADYRIVMSHTPDLADSVSQYDIDLYLCGHTHGGQVRIPFYGAIITLADSGKKYESGLYRAGKMWIHTSRGLGLEPPPATQVRFLCRPEITLITLRPNRPRPSVHVP